MGLRHRADGNGNLPCAGSSRGCASIGYGPEMGRYPGGGPSAEFDRRGPEPLAADSILLARPSVVNILHGL